MEEKLTEHFSFKEATTTSTGIQNLPTYSVIKNLFITADKMEEIRRLLGGNVIEVSSWFRNARVNAAVGGSRNSAHLSGLAVDFTCEDFGTPYQIVKHLESKRDLLLYDQLIYEKKKGTEWVHVGFVIPPAVPRLSTLTLMPDGSYKDGCIFQGETK